MARTPRPGRNSTKARERRAARVPVAGTVRLSPARASVKHDGVQRRQTGMLASAVAQVTS